MALSRFYRKSPKFPDLKVSAEEGDQEDIFYLSSGFAPSIEDDSVLFGLYYLYVLPH